MKKLLLNLILMFSFTSVSAHYIWIETAHSGKLNEKHTIKIRFGEYTHGEIEKTNSDSFKSVKNFSVWLVTPDGKKEDLSTIAKEDYYEASFIPKKNGAYTIALDNKEMSVLDFTKYDYTIFKPQYHAKAKVIVGNKVDSIKKTNNNSIEFVDENKTSFSPNSDVKLKVLYKGKPLVGNEVSIFMKNGWTKKLKTNKKGVISFKLPFKTKYTFETTFEEKTPGKFKGKDYKLIWHCATYCVEL